MRTGKPTTNYLRPAPVREVPLLLQVTCILGGFAQVGWLVLGVGLIFVWVVGLQADVSSVLTMRGPLSITTGTVTQVHSTKASEGGRKNGRGRPILQFKYRYEVNGRPHEGTSYSSTIQRLPGQSVEIEYPAGDPGLSRIRGMRKAVFGPEVLIVLIFPFIGLAIVVFGVMRGLHKIRLLRCGRLAEGKLVERLPTSVKVNNRPVIKYVFQFKGPDGHEHFASAQTSAPSRILDEERERVLFDPYDPTVAVLLDSLPAQVRFHPDGRIASFSSGMGYLVVPLITVAGHLSYLASRVG